MLYGVIARGWWMGQMSALFLGMAIVTFFVAKFDAGDARWTSTPSSTPSSTARATCSGWR